MLTGDFGRSELARPQGVFDLIKSLPPTLKYEPGTIVAEGSFVMVHGDFPNFGLPYELDCGRLSYALKTLGTHIPREACPGSSRAAVPVSPSVIQLPSREVARYQWIFWLTR
jgi:hypothetical protein